jgi:DNA-binding NarL/FixJ family response regulator
MALELNELQRKIVVGLARNKTYAAIAHETNLSTSRIGNIMTVIYDSLGFRGPAALAHWAIKEKLIKLGDFEK